MLVSSHDNNHVEVFFPKTYRDLHNQRESIRQGEMKEDDALSELTRNGKKGRLGYRGHNGTLALSRPRASLQGGNPS